MPERIHQLKEWLSSLPGMGEYSFEPASGDASFRRYFRIGFEHGTYIAMDAPPEKEAVGPFINIAERLESIGVHVPHIHAQDLSQGFLLLSDLGSRLYLGELTDENVHRLYGDALGALVAMQACAPAQGLPKYDSVLLRAEMALFKEWLLSRWLGITLSQAEERMLEETFHSLEVNALEQPQVFVHRDYHSRNLLATAGQNPGVIDFQDAVLGPVTYDLVSLLRDCYIRWPREWVEEWCMGYFELAVQSGVLQKDYEYQFLGWFDLMGVQRHLKASGIFARLEERDGKSGYLHDIPRTLGYISEISMSYDCIRGLGEFVQERVMPRLEEQLSLLQ